ncbi:MAG TPA: hypothetical protein PKE52_15905, partial [Bacteroidales bacterium]|nr:hypothetical protein [Bacteroidales bacterium]
MVNLLPDVIYRMTSLTTLKIGDCSLSTLSDDLSSLNNLTELDLNGNLFSKRGVPKVIFKLTCLKILNVNLCDLQQIPDDLSKLTSLSDLDY